jgi:hypothetical protein
MVVPVAAAAAVTQTIMELVVLAVSFLIFLHHYRDKNKFQKIIIFSNNQSTIGEDESMDLNLRYLSSKEGVSGEGREGSFFFKKRVQCEAKEQRRRAIGEASTVCLSFLKEKNPLPSAPCALPS